MKIKVNVRDKQKVLDALKAEGYSEAKLNTFINSTKLEFMAYANLVYWEILKKDPPQLITVNLVKKDDNADQFMVVSFLSRKSDSDHLLFEIHQPLIKQVLNDPTDRTYATAMIHEMMHAADHPIIERIDKVLDRFESKLKRDNNASNSSLLHTLQMLKHLRADSIANLGRLLLAQMKMGVSVYDLFDPFRQSFDIALKNAISCITPSESSRYDNISIDDSCHPEYVGPCILLMIISKLGLVKNELVKEALQGFQTGHYLEKRDAMTLLHASLSLSFADFIKGLLLLGEEYIPVRTILEYCNLLQQDGKEENMEALLLLLERPQPVSTFYHVVEQIIGKETLSMNLDSPYKDFCMDLPNPIDYPSLKTKISFLYQVMKRSNNTTECQIARNALAYYFTNEKAINDRIIGFGRVDDLIVIDHAIHLLKNCES